MATIHIGYTHNSGSAESAFTYTAIFTSAAELCTAAGQLQTMNGYWKAYAAGGQVWFGIFFPTTGTNYMCRSAVGPLAIGGVNWQQYNVSLSAIP